MDLSWLPPIAAAVASAATLATILRLVVADRHPLRLVERLGAVASDISDNHVRGLVTDFRDERLVSWVLTRRAPRERRLQVVAYILQVIGVVLFVAWAVGQASAPTSALHWVAYIGGLTGLSTAEAIRRVRMDRRRDWMSQERQWRQLQQPVPASRVTSPR